MATLETNGSFPELTIAEYEAFDRIVYATDHQKWTVSLIISDGGTLDLSDELAFTPAEISTSVASTTLISGIGNDWLYGNIGNDAISGNDGRDYVFGDAGNDTLWGDAGNDSLNGGIGTNVLYGGQGDDTLDSMDGNGTLIGGVGYDVYQADSGDVIIENPGEGVDTLIAYDHISLPANVENLTVITEEDGSLRGNADANTLRGGAGNDTLDGGNANDKLIGYYGDDTYILNDADRVIEEAGQGTDTVRVRFDYVIEREVENLVQTGTADIAATGNSLNNRITGNSGANRIDGGTGRDVLTGKGGSDTFIFSTNPRDDNIDTVADFNTRDDRMELAHSWLKTVPVGSLAPDAFTVGKVGAARDAEDRIIYDKTTGKLYYDLDGTGQKDAKVFAIVDPGLALGANDFLIV